MMGEKDLGRHGGLASCRMMLSSLNRARRAGTEVGLSCSSSAAKSAFLGSVELDQKVVIINSWLPIGTRVNSFPDFLSLPQNVLGAAQDSGVKTADFWGVTLGHAGIPPLKDSKLADYGKAIEAPSDERGENGYAEPKAICSCLLLYKTKARSAYAARTGLFPL